MHPSLKPIANAWLWTRPFYRAAADRRHTYTWAVDSRIRISHEYRFIYIRIPKAANTMLSHTLFQHVQGVTAASNSEAKNAFDRPSDLTSRDINHVLRDYHTFIFVRNPYERVLSAYLSKVRSTTREKKRYRDYVQRRLKLQSDTGISFTQFCHYLTKGGLYDDPHWLPQHAYAAMLGTDTLNSIGKVERLEQDCQAIFEILFPDQRTIQFSTKSGSRNKSGCKIEEFYDAECREIVRDLYRQDFSTFGYPA